MQRSKFRKQKKKNVKDGDREETTRFISKKVKEAACKGNTDGLSRRLCSQNNSKRSTQSQNRKFSQEWIHNEIIPEWRQLNMTNKSEITVSNRDHCDFEVPRQLENGKELTEEK